MGSPDASSITSSAKPYVFGLGWRWLEDGVTLSVRLAGGPAVRMLVDTGSNGVVIARTLLGSNYRLPKPRQPFTGFTYSSSGNSYSGEWVYASLTLSSVLDPNGRAATTAPMLIRAVDKQCDAAKRCTSSGSQLGVAMLGVGFDREQDGDKKVIDVHAGPGLNPFLNLSEMVAGKMPRSYLIGSGKVSLGVRATSNFATIALQSTRTATGTADWAAPQACVSAPPWVLARCGSLLIDTGLDYAIVQVPNGVDPPLKAAAAGVRPTVATGQQLTFTLPGLGGRPMYHFTVGSAGAPTKVEWGHNIAAHDFGSFFNVSRYALSQVDYLYDATEGRVGFEWTGSSGR